MKSKKYIRRMLMKKKLSKLLALILMLALLVSSFAIFASAETDTEGEGDTDAGDELEPIVVVNRDFADGWEPNNGFSSYQPKGHKFYIDKETTIDYGYNYFARIEAAQTFGSYDNEDGFMQLSFAEQNNPKKNHVYLEFDVMTDDVCNLGTVLYSRTQGSSNGVSVSLLGIYDNMLYPFSSKSYEGIDIKGKWVHVQIKFDYSRPDLDPDTQFSVEITLGEGEDAYTVSQDFTGNPGYIGVDIFRFGLTDVSSLQASIDRETQSWCLDNMQVCCNTLRPLTQEEFDAQGYGANVNTSELQSVVIEGVGGDKTTSQRLEESLCLKVDVNYALLKGEQMDIYDGTYGAPVEHNGNIMVPLDILLEYVGYEPYIHVDGKSYDFSTGSSEASITMGRDVATVNGELVSLAVAPGYYTDRETGKQYAVVGMEDIEKLLPGYYVTYDDMGLIIVSEVDEIINREEHLDTMIHLMKRFVYDYADGDEIYEDAKAGTDNFTHPFLMGDQSVIDRLIAIWNGTDTTEYDVDLKGTIDWQVDRAYRFLEAYSIPFSFDTRSYVDRSGKVIFSDDGSADTLSNPLLYDEKGEKLFYTVRYTGADFSQYMGIDWEKSDCDVFHYPHLATNGYDPDGGRQGESGTVTTNAQDIALGYIITGDIRLAQLAYDMLVAVGEWNHWAPGHFLNVADASQRFAIAFDWIYNGIAALEAGTVDTDGDGEPNPETADYYKISYLEYLLFKNGVHVGYRVSSGQGHDWKRPQGDISYYCNATNNWNAVCTGGMWLASLMLLGNEEYRYEASELISMNIKSLAEYGMDEYAPDGSYVEGPAYWGYGTNTLFIGLMGLMSATGKDYGFLDAPGMKNTCYFVCMTESSNYEMFNFSDASEGQMVDTSSFFFAAQVLNDPVLSEIRKLHLNNGKGLNFRDLFFYPYDEDESGSGESLPLDYFSSSNDLFTTRSSWETDSLFAGFMGGENNAPHGHIDSGNFVYHNAGIKWITDLGGEDYNVYAYFTTPTRYRYYRASAEGHNVIAITSQPRDLAYGQLTTARGKLISQYSNEYGAYAIIDNTPVYGEFAMLARRGTLLTNNRKTFVVQDEINLQGFETMYWFAQIRYSETSYEISPNGRTMYLISRENRDVQLRLTILSNGMNEKFTVTTCGETEEDRKLKGENGTVDYGFSGANGSMVNEKDRSGYRRIAIELNGNTVNMAVVIELIEDRDQEVGYSFRPMSSWVPEEHSGGSSDSIEDPDNAIERRPKASTSAMVGSIRKAQAYVESERQYDSKIQEYYLELANTWYHYYRFYEDELVAYRQQLEEYYKLKDEYDAYTVAVNGNVSAYRGLVRALMGLG